ncbi:MAG: acetylornithine/N-succinyldiaminopimelate aminotransferase [Thermosediminibacterales bacterium]|nr:acetylornithine/N-succinyldiaminopimelate aminotransferase [Thermosediminibacterales bacterium]MDK2836770.1 acetylornithine/N-succinyldiaminopimelate aminotransferase [Thermosediminibacterales bacterium]
MKNYSKEKLFELEEKYILNTYKRLPVVLVKGEGVYVWDSEGNKYLDFLAGIAVNSLGHCHPNVVNAIKKQAEELIHCSNLYYIEPQIKLAKKLVEISCADKAFFVNSGAEANEAAIKIARKYGKSSGKNRFEIITTLKSFHGRTLGALAATGQTKYQKGFGPLPEGFKYVAYNDLKAVEDAINESTCAVMVEPIQGEGGINIADPEYLQGLRNLCDKHDLLLIFDEIQCGLGRTGKMFAYEHSGVEPDIITLAKSLGGGVPIGAVLTKGSASNVFQPGDHGTTFGGNPLACSAANAVLDTLESEELIKNASVVGEYFLDKLNEVKEKYPVIKDVRGKGLMIGVELECEGAQFVLEFQNKGVLINCTEGKVLRFLPPLTIQKSHVDSFIDVFKEVLKDAESRIP